MAPARRAVWLKSVTPFVVTQRKQLIADGKLRLTSKAVI
jgi:hypothetical protein